MFKLIKSTLAVRKMRKLAVDGGRLAINEYWTDNEEAIKDLSPEFVKQQAESMMQEIIKVSLSPDPRMANRSKLRDCLWEMSRFQVLVIDPPSAKEQSGLRGQVGITGELKPTLFELYQADEGLRQLFHGSGETPKNWDDVWNPVLLRYRLCHAWTHIFHTLRFGRLRHIRQGLVSAFPCCNVRLAGESVSRCAWNDVGF
jgi:hypothetical protein